MICYRHISVTCSCRQWQLMDLPYVHAGAIMGKLSYLARTCFSEYSLIWQELASDAVQSRQDKSTISKHTHIKHLKRPRAFVFPPSMLGHWRDPHMDRHQHQDWWLWSKGTWNTKTCKAIDLENPTYNTLTSSAFIFPLEKWEYNWEFRNLW